MKEYKSTELLWSHEVATTFRPDAEAVIAQGDSLEMLRGLPDGFAKLIITSPPYNVGKVYEKATNLTDYLIAINPIIDQLARVLSDEGSLCWQVGNYVENGEVFPLDIFYYNFFKERGFKLRNRIKNSLGYAAASPSGGIAQISCVTDLRRGTAIAAHQAA